MFGLEVVQIRKEGLWLKIKATILEDPTTIRGCEEFCERKGVPTEEVVEDLSDLVYKRVNFFRAKDLPWIQKWWEGLHDNSEIVDFVGEISSFASKYGVNFEQARYASDNAYTSIRAMKEAEDREFLETVKSYARVVGKAVTGFLLLAVNPTLAVVGTAMFDEFGIRMIEGGVDKGRYIIAGDGEHTSVDRYGNASFAAEDGNAAGVEGGRKSVCCCRLC